VVDDLNFLILQPLFGTTRSFTRAQDVENKSYAAYGQSSYSITEQLRATLGVRVTHDEKGLDRRQLAFETNTDIQAEVINSVSSNDVSPRIGFDYQWTPNLMTYVSVAKGYKAGGFNGRASTAAGVNEFSPEKVWTYEAGLRSDWLEHRVRFNATAFYSNYFWPNGSGV
jgi:iron complex outermembrane recepter protein